MVNQVSTTYQQGTEKFNLGEAAISDLLNLGEVTTLTVHGKPLIVSKEELNRYINSEGSAITNEAEMAEFLATHYSPQDVEDIYRQQIHRRITGKRFDVNNLGNAEAIRTEELVLVVPRVNVTTRIIEQVIESAEQDDLTKYITYLPSGAEYEEEEKVAIVTGNTLRSFLNDVQTEEGGLTMDSQILVYAHLLTGLPDDDPTKKYALMQMRAIMVYGDSVSNKNLRLSLTEMIKEE